MKNILTLLWLIPTVVCAQKSYPVENMNLETKPGDNFMEYATGQWIKNHPLKDNEYENGAFRGCMDSVTARMSRILTDLLVLPQKKGSVGEAVSIIYKQYSDTAQRNELGIQPIQAELQAIRAAKSTKELQAIMARQHQQGGSNFLFNWEIRPDLMHADSNIVATSTYGSPIPANYYWSFKHKKRAICKDYRMFQVRMFETLGYSHTEAEVRAKKTFALEKRLIKGYMSTFGEFFQSKDFAHSVHKISRIELEKKYPNIAWNQLFRTSTEAMDVRIVDVSQPRTLKIADNLLKKEDFEDLKSLAEFRLIIAFGGILTQDIRRDYRALQASMVGNTKDQDQWKINANFLASMFSMQMGQLYCEKYFPTEAKERVKRIAENIAVAFRQRIQQNTWLTEETKQQALKKLDNIVWEIAYPEEWESLGCVQITPKNTLRENISNLIEQRWDQKVRRTLNQPVDRHYWEDAPQTVNAYNSLPKNRITLCAGILQPPFFDPSADEAINYGAIGVVIAHELTHGYDPNGCQFDSIGNVHDWWTRKDKHAFSRRTKVLRRYFGNLKLGKEKVDGARTLAENVADNGGLNIALEAMHRAGINDTINGQTAEQRFFLGYARMWARNCRPDYLWYVIHNDTHAPSETRVNGALPHIDAWYNAYGIDEKDTLFLKKDKRAVIW